MESKKRKLEESLQSGVYGAADRANDLVHKYIAPFSAIQISELLAEICTHIPEAFSILQQKADESLNHRKVFARGLAWNSTGQDLADILSKHGRILETSVITDKATGMSKGFAFVTFETAAEAAAAVEEGSYKLDGRTVYTTIAAIKGGESSSSAAGPAHAHAAPVAAPVAAPYAATALPQPGYMGPTGGESLDARKVFLRGLSYNTTADTVRGIFNQFGPIDKLELLTDKDTGKFKGSAFITYSNSQCADTAVRAAEFQIDGRTVHAHRPTERQGGSAGASRAMAPAPGPMGAPYGGMPPQQMMYATPHGAPHMQPPQQHMQPPPHGQPHGQPPGQQPYMGQAYNPPQAQNYPAVGYAASGVAPGYGAPPAHATPAAAPAAQQYYTGSNPTPAAAPGGHGAPTGQNNWPRR